MQPGGRDGVIQLVNSTHQSLPSPVHFDRRLPSPVSYRSTLKLLGETHVQLPLGVFMPAASSSVLRPTTGMSTTLRKLWMFCIGEDARAVFSRA